MRADADLIEEEDAVVGSGDNDCTTLAYDSSKGLLVMCRVSVRRAGQHVSNSWTCGGSTVLTSRLASAVISVSACLSPSKLWEGMLGRREMPQWKV